MPAVGPDGKNVMKLIPVQKVNGQYIPMQTSYGKTNLPVGPQSPQPIHLAPPPSTYNKLPVVEPTSDGRYILKGPASANVGLKSQQKLPSPRDVVGQMRLPALPPQRTQSTTVPVPVPVTKGGAKTVTSPMTTQLPVTVRSPRLPNGHYLQIPPDARIQTLPASALPQSIKRRIWDLPQGSSPVDNSSTVVYVSPVNSMTMGTPTMHNDHNPPVTQNQPTLRPSTHAATVAGPAASLASPSVSSRLLGSESSAPMKWVVQQKDQSSAPCLVPASSTYMAAEILKAVAQREKKSLQAPKPSSSQSREIINPGKEDALVMCNGRVYFVTNKDNRLCGPAQENPPTAKESPSPRKQTVSPNARSNARVISITDQRSQPICIEDDPKDDVIDLCDDDPLTEGTSGDSVATPGPAVTKTTRVTPEEEEEDDSTVIFVSYIPPKTSTASNPKDAPSETGAAKPSPHKTVAVSHIPSKTYTPNSPKESLSETSSVKPNPLKAVVMSCVPPKTSITSNPKDAPTEASGVKSSPLKMVVVSHVSPKTSHASHTKEAQSEIAGVKSNPLNPVGVSSSASSPKDTQSPLKQGGDIGKVTNQVCKQLETCSSPKQTESHQGLLNDTAVPERMSRIDLTIEEPAQREPEEHINAAQPVATCEGELRHIANNPGNDAEMKDDQNSGQRVDLQTGLDIVAKDSPLKSTPVSEPERELSSAKMESKNTQKELIDEVQNTENTREAVQVLSGIATACLSQDGVDLRDQHKNDSKMRQLFGITKDVKVCLPRTPSPNKEAPSEIRSINKRTLEGIRKLIQGSQMEIKAKKIIEAQVQISSDAKRKKVDSPTEPSEIPSQPEVTVQPPTSPKCGLSSSLQSKKISPTLESPVQNKVPSASSAGESSDTTDDTDTLQDACSERLPSSNLSHRIQESPGESQPPLAGSCNIQMDISSQDVPMSERTDFQSGQALNQGEPSQLGKEPSLSASVDSQNVTTNTNSTLDEKLFYTQPMEPEEIKQCEKIKRLKELLKQKEAALEAMRRKMSM
ncbi:uncharacterized protein lrif1 isoform X2 [Engraulis encrasicolus]